MNYCINRVLQYINLNQYEKPHRGSWKTVDRINSNDWKFQFGMKNLSQFVIIRRRHNCQYLRQKWMYQSKTNENNRISLLFLFFLFYIPFFYFLLFIFYFFCWKFPESIVEVIDVHLMRKMKSKLAKNWMKSLFLIWSPGNYRKK